MPRIPPCWLVASFPGVHGLCVTSSWAARSAGLEVTAEPRIVATGLHLLEQISGQPRRSHVETIGRKTRQRLRRARKRPLGDRRILRQNPHHLPRRVARSRAPRFHAATWQIRKMLEAAYRAYRDAYREASEAIDHCRIPVRFPSHGIPPPLVNAANRS